MYTHFGNPFKYVIGQKRLTPQVRQNVESACRNTVSVSLPFSLCICSLLGIVCLSDSRFIPNEAVLCTLKLNTDLYIYICMLTTALP